MSNKTKIYIIRALCVILISIVFVIIEAFYLEPNRLVISAHTYESNSIPNSFDDFSIVFFSDLHFGTSITPTNISLIVDKINNLQPDLILFGGDLVDHPVTSDITQDDYDALETALKSMYAKYGKIAVLGNHDLDATSSVERITGILENANFTILNNQSIRFHNASEESIKIVGVESQVLGNVDIPKAFNDVRADDFTILLCHTPDIMKDVSSSLVDIAFTGHSHGHQVYIPLISDYFLPPFAQTYSKGIYKVDQSLLYVSNGIGTTKLKARLFSNPEIVFYRLSKTNPIDVNN